MVVIKGRQFGAVEMEEKQREVEMGCCSERLCFYDSAIIGLSDVVKMGGEEDRSSESRRRDQRPAKAASSRSVCSSFLLTRYLLSTICVILVVVCGPCVLAPIQILIIGGPGAHNCHNDYKPRCRCFDLGIELSYHLISLMTSPFSPVQLEWIRHCQ
jgi:hypothetical protein